jgi:hypothetical protein
MTAQIADRVEVGGRAFDIAGVNGGAMFDPAENGEAGRIQFGMLAGLKVPVAFTVTPPGKRGGFHSPKWR